MKLAALLTLVAFAAQAQAQAGDAPVIGSDEPVGAVVVERGHFRTPSGAEFSVQGGAYLPHEATVATARRIVSCETELDALRSKGPDPFVVVAVVASVVLVGATGVYIGRTLR